MKKGGRKITTQEFIDLSRQVHGDKYEYTYAVYLNKASKVSILCPKHGVFEQKAGDHLRGRGCKFCGGTHSNNQLFLEKARLVHGNLYCYDEVIYRSCDTKVTIICHDHGRFEQKPAYHLGGSGCQVCGLFHQKHNTAGWGRKRYVERGLSKYNGLSFLYVMRCSLEDEVFYKLGISFKGGKRRLKYSGYKTMTLYNLELPVEVCWDAEKYLHRILKQNRYNPNIPFDGSKRECYKELNIEAIDVLETLKEGYKLDSYSKIVEMLKKDGSEIQNSLTPEKCDLLHMIMGLVLESSELGDAIKKHIMYNQPLDIENVIEELGDIEFFLEGIRQNLSISREETIDANIKKLGVRYQAGVYSDQAAQDRADKA